MNLTSINGLDQVNTLATHTALTAWSAVSDFLIVIILLSLFFVFARGVGRGPFVALLLAFYAAYALYAAFPYASFLPTAPAITAVLAHAALYLALVFVFYIILRRVAASDFIYIGLFGLFILSFLGSAFLLALAYHTFSVTSIYQFTPAISALFAPNEFFFWWFIAPAIGLFFFAR